MKKIKFALTQLKGENQENIVSVTEIENTTDLSFNFQTTQVPNILITESNNLEVFENAIVENGKNLINGNVGWVTYDEGNFSELYIDTFIQNADNTTVRSMEVLNKEVFTIYFPNL